MRSLRFPRLLVIGCLLLLAAMGAAPAVAADPEPLWNAFPLSGTTESAPVVDPAPRAPAPSTSAAADRHAVSAEPARTGSFPVAWVLVLGGLGVVVVAGVVAARRRGVAVTRPLAETSRDGTLILDECIIRCRTSRAWSWFEAVATERGNGDRWVVGVSPQFAPSEHIDPDDPATAAALDALLGQLAAQRWQRVSGALLSRRDRQIPRWFEQRFERQPSAGARSGESHGRRLLRRPPGDRRAVSG